MTKENSTVTPSRRLLLVLVLVTALGPFSLQLFIPGMPVIQQHFSAGAAVVQLTFSLSTLAMAVATLIYGPLSDRIGRRPTVIGGLVLYLLGSLICAVAPSLGIIIVGRIIQMAGGAVGLVLSRAIIRDLYDREGAAKMMAYVTMAMVVAPMIAPVLGGVVTDLLGWRWIFVVAAIAGVIVFVSVRAGLIETGRPGGSVQDLAGMLTAFARLLRAPAFLGYALQGAFSIAVFYGFLATAPYVMITVLGRPASEYGLYFTVITGAFMVGNFLAARLSARIGSERMIVLGSSGSFASALVTCALLLAGIWHPLAIFLPTSVGAFFQGMSMPNSQAAVVSVAPELAGSASGLAGFIQMAVAAIAAQTVGSIQNGTPYPMTFGMVFCSGVALCAAIWARSSHGLSAGRARSVR